MSHRRNNIVLGGVGLRVLRKDEEVGRTKAFHLIFVIVPRTFGDYCRSRTPLRIGSRAREICGSANNLICGLEVF